MYRVLYLYDMSKDFLSLTMVKNQVQESRNNIYSYVDSNTKFIELLYEQKRISLSLDFYLISYCLNHKKNKRSINKRWINNLNKMI